MIYQTIGCSLSVIDTFQTDQITGKPMDIRSLRCFQMVAREANFTRAAEQLHLAQPAVSMSVKRLENELGLTLLNHGNTSTGISLAFTNG